VDAAIEANRIVSLQMRMQIREYSKRFFWSHLTSRYLRLVSNLLFPKKNPISNVPVAKTSTTLVTAYYQIQSKQPHSFYLPHLVRLVTLVNQRLIFWTSREVEMELAPLANSNVIFRITSEFPTISKWPDSFWQRQVDRDVEKYHTVPLAKMWYLKHWFVLQTTQNQEYTNHNFIWIDAGCVRREEDAKALISFGSRMDFTYQDDKMHVQVIEAPPIPTLVTPEYVFYTYPAIQIGCAIMSGTKNAWYLYSLMYDDILNQYDQVQISGDSDQYITMSCIQKTPSLFTLHKCQEIHQDPWFAFLHFL
jgi:hypothetical protein